MVAGHQYVGRLCPGDTVCSALFVCPSEDLLPRMLVWTSAVAILVAGVVTANDVFIDDNETGGNNHHHKVHNLVLNPEQHSLCELKHIRQIVTHAHCTSKEMENYVCVGTCFSYTVPQTEPETPGDELLDYCDSCQASESHWTTIELDCEEYGNGYTVNKNIQMITNCSCSPCHPSRAPIDNEVTHQPNDHHVSELLYKMLPNSHKFKENGVHKAEIGKELKYKQVSLGDLKKEFNLDANQEQLLHGRVLFKDAASFTDNDEEEDPRHHSY
ncbi:uncharacterized protein LOC134771277 [Penaeus indicus]|uniref:uncharacterized protein LOC134771277 n=1 Tax=Penaeus indicus TaxID=29960 RepID=UPI00300CC089